MKNSIEKRFFIVEFIMKYKDLRILLRKIL